MLPSKIDLSSYNPLKASHLEMYQDQIRSNIRHLLEIATNEDIKIGLSWYEIANSYSLELAENYNLSADQSAGIIAALSPNVEWNLNMIAAKDLIAYQMIENYRGYYANVKKALRILYGELPDKVLGGNKVRSFYQNILNPYDPRYVTIDTHTVRALLLYPRITFNNSSRYYCTKAKYSILGDSFRIIASQNDLIPCQCQAIVWTVYKRLYGKVYK